MVRDWRPLGEDMPLRIHFTAEDLARTRIASGPDHMWEIASSLQLLQHADGALVFDEWRSWARRRLHTVGLDTATRALSTIYPHATYFPDFLTPATPSDDLESGIDTVLATPATRLRTELLRLGEDRPLPDWARRVAEGDLETMRGIGTALHRYHDAIIGPHLDRIRGQLDEECAVRTRLLRAGGLEAFFHSLRPMMSWRYPLLEVDYPCDQDLYLGGRGLVFVPSFFTWGTPVTLADPDLPPILVYPVHHRTGWLSADDDQRASPLAALIGETRTAVLAATVNGATTGEVARRLGVAAATITYHTGVLRGADLISSRRFANTMVHTITARGAALLSRAPVPSRHVA